MIKRLRRKFILINLLLVGLVLAVVFILFVGANVRRLAGQSDAALRLALSWQEGEGPPRFEIGGPPPEEREPDGAHRFSLIPVFVVTVKDGAITGLNDGGQVDVSEETAARATKMKQALRELGLQMTNPLLRIATLALPVVPEAKFTDLGLVDVMSKSFVPLFPEA